MDPTIVDFFNNAAGILKDVVLLPAATFGLGVAVTTGYNHLKRRRADKRMREGNHIDDRGKTTLTIFEAVAGDNNKALQIINPGVVTQKQTKRGAVDHTNAYFEDIFSGGWSRQIIKMIQEVKTNNLANDNCVVWDVLEQTPTAQKIKSSTFQPKHFDTAWDAVLAEMQRNLKNYFGTNIEAEKLREFGVNWNEIVPVLILEPAARVEEFRFALIPSDFSAKDVPNTVMVRNTTTGMWEHDPKHHHMERLTTMRQIAAYAQKPVIPKLGTQALATIISRRPENQPTITAPAA